MIHAVRASALLFLGTELAGAAFVGAPGAPAQRGAVAAVSPTMAFDGEALVSVPSNVLRTNSLGAPWVEQRSRPRRNRKSEAMRRMVRENQLSPADFIYPLFIHDEDSNVLIASMPGCERHSLKSMVAEAKDAWQYGVRTFVVFPKVDDALKSVRGEEACNPDGIVPRAVKMLKDALPDSIICTDVALDPYSSKGHDGIVEGSKILNDPTIEQLCKQSIMQAKAGADVVAPSDMMDGRVGAIRDALDSEGFTDVSILAYTAKYASAYYGPFRDALDSHPGFGDKKTYQQVCAVSRGAERPFRMGGKARNVRENGLGRRGAGWSRGARSHLPSVLRPTTVDPPRLPSRTCKHAFPHAATTPTVRGAALSPDRAPTHLRTRPTAVRL